MNEITVVRIYEDDNTSYEIRGDGEYLQDCESLEDAISQASEFAEAQGIEYVKFQIATESI